MENRLLDFNLTPMVPRRQPGRERKWQRGSSGQESTLLKRIDELLRATKKAHQRGGVRPLVRMQVGQKLMDYILKGV
jgi:hypothetical protein